MPEKAPAPVQRNGADRRCPPDVVETRGPHGRERATITDPRPPVRKPPVRIGRSLIVGTAAVAGIVLAAATDDAAVDRIVLASLGLITLATLWRMATRPNALRPHGHDENAIIVGAGDVGQLVARKLLRHPEYGINLIGFVDKPPKQWRRDVAGVPVLGRFDDLLPIVQASAVDRVIFAFSQTRDEEMLDRVRSLAGLNVRVDVIPRMFEVLGPATGLPDIEGIPLVSIAPHTRSVVSMWLKRAIDVLGACLGLVLASPFFLWAAWRIPRETRGPVFFRQPRLGHGMKEFTMLKFRTMAADTDQSLHQRQVERAMSSRDGVAAGELYKADPGGLITPTGRWLRRMSLDELPQLINVLRGDMSLVGPRPCLEYETQLFAARHFERFQAPAGITGLWQVKARAHASFEEALDMDVVYVRDWSLRLDIWLLLRTPIEVLRQRKATV